MMMMMSGSKGILCKSQPTAYCFTQLKAGDLLDSVKLYDIFMEIARDVRKNSAILSESGRFALLDTVKNRSYNKK